MKGRGGGRVGRAPFIRECGGVKGKKKRKEKKSDEIK